MLTQVMVVLMALGVSGAAAVPQPPTVAGTWTVSIDAAKDPPGASRTRSRNAVTATMTLRVEGASVSGTWHAAPGGPVPVKGTWADGRLDLESPLVEASGTGDGKPMKVQLRWVIRGSLTNGRLGGSCAVIFGRDDDPLWSRWIATRVS